MVFYRFSLKGIGDAIGEANKFNELGVENVKTRGAVIYPSCVLFWYGSLSICYDFGFGSRFDFELNLEACIDWTGKDNFDGY